MKRLGGWDALLLYSETPALHQHTLKVAIVDAADYKGGEYSFDSFRQMVGRRLHLLEPLRYRLIDVPFGFHHPMWLEHDVVDLGYHLRQFRVGSPGGRRELDKAIGLIASTPLDRSRPLWECYFVEGLADNRFALIGKIHHALADGVASANLWAHALGLDDAPHIDADPYVPDPRPSPAELLRAAAADHLAQLKELPKLVKDTHAGLLRLRRHRRTSEVTRGGSPPRTFINNHAVPVVRRFASASLALADVKQTSKHLGITINDLVLAMSAGALRSLLLRYDGHADEPLVVGVPISINPSPDRKSGNALGLIVLSMPVHLDQPLDRVRQTAANAKASKETNALLGPELASRWTQYLPPRLIQAGFARLAQANARNKLVNLSISNVPGPRVRGHILDAPMSELLSVGPLTARIGLNITVWSYVEQLNLCVLEDGATVTDPHEVTDALVAEFIAIREAAGLSPRLARVDSAMP